MEEKSLRPVWSAILEVYKPFAALCERHHLRMWVAFGTLLGAVRHRGFIPWDDDFDVMMPRSDYQKFIEIASRELPPHLKLITQLNSPEFSLPFAKVQETRRRVVESVEKEIGGILHQGIYIDVFPLDGVDGWRTPLANRLVCCIMKLRRAYLYRSVYPKSRKNILLFVLGFVCGVFVPRLNTRERFNMAYEEMMRRKSFDESEYCTYYDSTYIRQHPYKVSDYKKTVMLDFENIKVPAPYGWHDWLTSEFGDYMTPPPKSKQVSTHQNILAEWKYGSTMRVNS